jgi:hypothetical protein
MKETIINYVTDNTKHLHYNNKETYTVQKQKSSTLIA